MLNLESLRNSKLYQEAVLETKLETVPKLMKLGLNIEQVAEFLELDVETVRKAVKQ